VVTGATGCPYRTVEVISLVSSRKISVNIDDAPGATSRVDKLMRRLHKRKIRRTRRVESLVGGLYSLGTVERRHEGKALPGVVTTLGKER
jgi:hypothetical protein